MLYFVGLGLFDLKDISLKGLDVLKNVDVVYAEFFTSRLFGSNFQAIEELIGNEIIILNREEVEEENVFLKDALNKNVALICGGDPLIATTHTDFLLEAKKMGIETKVIHGSSILSAAPGISGLQAYKFGKVTTIPFPDHNFFPHSPYLAIADNLINDAHTLVLLDIQYHKDRYMTINQGLEYLLEVRDDLIAKNKEVVIDEKTLAIGIARVGSYDVIVKAGSIEELIEYDFGGPLHCIVIPSKLHIVEAEYLVEIANGPKHILDNV
ncbi:ribosomal RNA small subunit methyltransferase I [Methanobrevibacter cuticularis]|uniref:Diphthine synthase n=1 Tax=Methanobrevibacter cuticularis TaxID=47311 RepID=A0A166EMC4_9EURY|nr:diphthine synthase [Methanobrevibacter cuticularis]KZX16811.1 ribosomal RNA small subunit methyltransferase I [Methanobrevibacter cuticularis]